MAQKKVSSKSKSKPAVTKAVKPGKVAIPVMPTSPVKTTIKSKKKINCSAMVKTLAASGMSEDKILKKVQHYNPKFKPSWVTAIAAKLHETMPQTTTIKSTEKSKSTLQPASTSVLSLRKGGKVLRVYPPTAELSARVFPGIVTDVQESKIICKMQIDKTHKMQMEFDPVTGMGSDNTGAFIIKCQ
jgi:hypothetical protein